MVIFRERAWGRAVIPVKKKPQPKGFKSLVGNPGAVFLAANPTPSSKDFKGHEYWTKIACDLNLAYDRICAYSCHFIASDTGVRTVEHFRPKTVYPNLAYKWSNYRLVCSRLNGRKSDFEDVLDPFAIEDESFVLDFPGTIVKPSPFLTGIKRLRVEKTIKRLKLNDDESCIDARQQWLLTYCDIAKSKEAVAYAFLKKFAPFLAKELDRQGLRGKPILKQMSTHISPGAVK